MNFWLTVQDFQLNINFLKISGKYFENKKAKISAIKVAKLIANRDI